MGLVLVIIAAICIVAVCFLAIDRIACWFWDRKHDDSRS